MKITGILPKGKTPNLDDQLITMEVTFGKHFTNKPLTRKEFVDRLRDEAKKHPRSFLKQMMEHFAEHIEAAADFDPVNHALSSPANLKFFNSYGGQGSCSTCTSNVSPPTCCSCTHDDTTSCEPC